MRTCQHWDKVRAMEAPGPWVHRVAINLAISDAAPRPLRAPGARPRCGAQRPDGASASRRWPTRSWPPRWPPSATTTVPSWSSATPPTCRWPQVAEVLAIPEGTGEDPRPTRPRRAAGQRPGRAGRGGAGATSTDDIPLAPAAPAARVRGGGLVNGRARASRMSGRGAGAVAGAAVGRAVGGRGGADVGATAASPAAPGTPCSPWCWSRRRSQPAPVRTTTDVRAGRTSPPVSATLPAAPVRSRARSGGRADAVDRGGARRRDRPRRPDTVRRRRRPSWPGRPCVRSLVARARDGRAGRADLAAPPRDRGDRPDQGGRGRRAARRSSTPWGWPGPRMRRPTSRAAISGPPCH